VIEFEGKAAKFKEIEKEHSKIGNMQNLQNRIVELEQQLNFQTEKSKELEIKNTDLSESIMDCPFHCLSRKCSNFLLR